jgi:RNA 2',3'-cyclic 3'-phosphodiesterase
MRTFISLNLDDEQRRAVDLALVPLRERSLPLRWLDTGGLHLTLKFLGDTESSYIRPLTDALRQVAARHEPVRLRLGGLGAFPSLRRASVLWLAIEPDPPLMALQRDVETAMFSLGYPRELRPFRPHVTVARTQAAVRQADLTRVTIAFDYTGSCDVPGLSLMRSHPGPDGSQYETLVRARFGREAH